MAHKFAISRRQRRWLRLAVTFVLSTSGLAACLGIAVAVMLLILLAAACVFPFLWPRQFGSRRGLALLLLAILVPALVTAAFWPNLDTTNPQLAAPIQLWVIATWAMLPATLVLLLWRRLASIPVLLLGIAVMPAAVLLIALMAPPGTAAVNAETANMATTMRYIAAMTPMWFVISACCLGPIFFLGSLGWLLYLEATRGEKKPPVISPAVTPAVIPAPPARVEDARRSAGTPSPGES